MPRDNLYVESKVREHLKSRACSLSSTVTGNPLNNAIRENILDPACKRAKANGRKTVMDKDL